jgi:hypothetical protein
MVHGPRGGELLLEKCVEVVGEQLRILVQEAMITPEGERG